MKQFIIRLIFAYKYKRAVKKANKLAKETKRRYYVLQLKGQMCVLTKHTIKHWVATRRFRKGVKMQDIERMVLYSTL